MLVWVFLSLLVVIHASQKAQGILPATAAPGRLFLWSPSGPAQESHLTASYDVRKAIDHIVSEASNYDAVVVLSTQGSVLADAALTAAVQQAPVKTIISHVYPLEASTQPIHRALSSSHPEVSLKDALQKMLSGSTGTGAVHHVTYDSSSLQQLQELALNHKIMLVAYDEPHPLAAAPRRLGMYLLTTPSAADTNNPQSIYYKPEGAEYSIYYADTYLYITPDIFTGLLTGLFFFFVGLIGLSCLGEIQGMSSFYDKLPVVGREA